MKKSSFLTIATFFLATIAMPTVCMENPLELSTETPIIINVDLHLKKGQVSLHDSYDKKSDEHFWQLLGINKKITNNTYVVAHAFTHSPNQKDIKYPCLPNWTTYIPNNLPQSILPNPSIKSTEEYPDLPYQYNKFANTLPDTFVEDLKKAQDQTITLTDTKFAKPVTVIVTLKESIDNSETHSQKNNVNSTDIPNSYYQGLQLFAHITDMDNKIYTCCLKDNFIWIHEQQDDEEYKLIRGCVIPTDKTLDAYLLQITNNQWVIMDKDYKFYTWDGKSKYPLQSTKNSNHSVKALRNVVLIKLSQEAAHQESSEQNDQQLEFSKENTLNQTSTASSTDAQHNDQKKEINTSATKPSQQKAPEKTTQSNTKKYMLGGLGISIISFIAYLIYLHQNNQLSSQLSHISDFIRNLTSNKI